MKKCEYYQKLISDRMDEPLAAESARELNIHLKQCSDCAEFLKTLQKQSVMIRTLAAGDDGAHVSAAEALNRTSQPTWRRMWQTRFSLPLPVAASLLAVWLLSGLFFVTGIPREAHVTPVAESPAVECLHTLSLKPARPVEVVLSNVPEKEEEK